ncbi:MAG: hypothetical protein PHE78_03430 [Candidatus Gastranaerophilales bacterium]|nr:hypothetical protein [Candidatus Gastranaerophilales bacterium]
MRPPIEEISKERNSWIHYFEHKPLGPVADSRLYLPDFRPPSLNELKQKGNIDIQIPTQSPGSVRANVASDASSIKVGADKLGKYEKTNIKLNYGNTVDWSEQKVARDLMQNFYDGHGHTLE